MSALDRTILYLIAGVVLAHVFIIPLLMVIK